MMRKKLTALGRLSRKMKGIKAQAIGHILMYLVALTILVLIINYGYTSVQKFRKQADQVIYLKFKSQLEKISTKMASEYKSVSREVMEVPTKYSEIIFIDLNSAPPSGTICNPSHPDYQPLVCNSWRDKVQKNVFLVEEKTGLAADSIYIENIGLSGSDNYKIFKVNAGRIKIEFKGEGEKTVVGEWSG